MVMWNSNNNDDDDDDDDDDNNNNNNNNNNHVENSWTITKSVGCLGTQRTPLGPLGTCCG